MRGRRDPRVTMLALVDMEERVTKDHPLRTIKPVADEALERLSREFDRMYSEVGRASVPPETAAEGVAAHLSPFDTQRAGLSARSWNTISCFAGSWT